MSDNVYTVRQLFKILCFGSKFSSSDVENCTVMQILGHNLFYSFFKGTTWQYALDIFVFFFVSKLPHQEFLHRTKVISDQTFKKKTNRIPRFRTKVCGSHTVLFDMGTQCSRKGTQHSRKGTQRGRKGTQRSRKGTQCSRKSRGDRVNRHVFRTVNVKMYKICSFFCFSTIHKLMNDGLQS